jgi:hypothetical protein
LSSILDALRRLDTDGRSAAEDAPVTWMDRSEARRGGLARLQEALLMSGRKWLTAGVLLVVLGGGAWAGWRWISPKSVEPTPTLASAPAETKPPILAEAPPVPRPPAKPVAARETPARRPAAKMAPPPTAMPWAETRAPRVVVAPVAPRGAPLVAPSPAEDLLPLLPTEIGLSLQAVSWATRAQDRIAVVNGQILHQGDDIEGYTVRDIDSDALVLCRSGECYRLRFAFGR